MADSTVPVYTTLADVFNDAASTLSQATRWDKLAEQFRNRFGRYPTIIARAPGRVNLIGEHIDYALFGVFPAAIERDILIAAAPSENGAPGSITAENVGERYPRQDFAPTKTDGSQGWHLDIDRTQLRWESYVKAGYFGVLERFFKDHDEVPKGADILVSGNVPPGSGLSSSAAMVVASTLSFLAINNKLEGLTRGELVQITVENEKRVGVNSGGMDQSASVISSAGSALYVSFFPKLSATHIPLPVTHSRAVFVCANSCVVSEKLVDARTRYNLRVVETLVAARILARALGVSVGDKEKVTLREVLGRWVGLPGRGEISGVDDESKLKDALDRVLKELHVLKSPTGTETESGVTLEEMISMSGLTDEAFHELYLSWVDVEATHFQLFKRTKHVFEEALRVLQFRDICLQASGSGKVQDDNVLKGLGNLMDESHKSCSQLFECSCPELDLLVRLAKEAGAYGSRLTGAGWGGCTVSLVEESAVPAFITTLRKAYPLYHGLDDDLFGEVIFPTKPGNGACVFKFTDDNP